MYILGISCYYHDAAAALLQDGMLVAAAEEERFTRKKHDYGFTSQSIDFCFARSLAATWTMCFLDHCLNSNGLDDVTANLLSPSSHESMITWFNEKPDQGQYPDRVRHPERETALCRASFSQRCWRLFAPIQKLLPPSTVLGMDHSSIDGQQIGMRIKSD
jgi:hypothetical protein